MCVVCARVSRKTTSPSLMMVAASSSALAPVDSETPRYYFDAEGTLKLDGDVVKVYFFADEPDAPWFQAKPIHNFLGATTVAHTMARVSADDKSSLKGLLEAKGAPIRGGSSALPTLETLGHNDGKAYFVNEAGLYQIVFGSDKPVAG